MRNWNSFYEIMVFPIGILYFALTLLGIGNILTNPAYSVFYTVNNEAVLLAAEVCTRAGSFLIVNFPIYFMLRTVARRSGSATGILAAFAGYIVYLVVTMCFSGNALPSAAFSSILGISLTSTRVQSLSSGVRYPLQTGLPGAMLVALITLICYGRSRKRSDYSPFSFMSREMRCVTWTGILCAGAGLLMTYGWPYVVKAIQTAVNFVAADTTNPVNLLVYGMLDRFSALMNLGAMVRTPFWYGSSGGTWINMVGGSVAGDVNIWTSQMAVAGVSGMTGRFITPYYVLNIFAVPGLLWGMYSLKTDFFEKRRTRLFFILTSILSALTGTLLPVEMTLFLLCPFLYVFHLLYTGTLYAVFQAMGVYLGYNYTGTTVLSALPGTLPEFLSYLRFSGMQRTLLIIAAVGAFSFVFYFFFTRLYFFFLALDLFQTGRKDQIVRDVVDAAGGIENIKITHSSSSRLVISVYDPTKFDMSKLRKLGSVRVYDTKAGYAITFGAASTMIRLGITRYMRESIRNLD